MEFVRLVHSRLEAGSFAQIWLNGSELVSEDGFKRYWADGLFLLIEGNAPPDAQLVERPFGGNNRNGRP
jgi:hypothetical protein